MTLQDVVDKESKRIKRTYHGRSYHAIQHIVRSLDNVLTLYFNSTSLSHEEVNDFREFFRFGWPSLLKNYYGDIDINIHEPFPLMTSESINWAYSNILYSGKIEFCKQLIAYEKADLIKIIKTKKNEFTFKYLKEETGIERFDVASYNFYKEKIVEKIIERKKTEKKFDEENIKNELKKIIKNPHGKLISYITTAELDEYYNDQGHYQVLRLQGYDEFDKNDKFGNVEYWKYIDIIEIIIGTALLHLDACLELKKMNDNVNLHDILSYTFFKDKTLNEYATYIGTSIEEIEQIFSCITLTKDNFEYYLRYPATPPPIYFQVSKNIMIRSIAGCLSNPFSLLNRELKRKYKSDYDKALNNRENRFRKELFGFFHHDRIVKIPREINISFRGMRTDIDAVAFDTQTGTLGLFQLKWQDPFEKCMVERHSRISNLFPKINEWISKMKFWTSHNTSKTIINSLQIDKFYKGNTPINEIYVFVISRNTINFTGIEKDETVAWSSWYQLIEAQASIRTMFDDPIREMYIKIKNFEPKIRIKTEGLSETEDFSMDIAETKIYYKKTHNI
jgi:hypothetical protein